MKSDSIMIQDLVSNSNKPKAFNKNKTMHFSTHTHNIILHITASLLKNKSFLGEHILNLAAEFDI